MSEWNTDNDPEDHIVERPLSWIRKEKEQSLWYGWVLGAGVALVAAWLFNTVFGL